jgi:hypothetical protein
LALVAGLVAVMCVSGPSPGAPPLMEFGLVTLASTYGEVAADAVPPENAEWEQNFGELGELAPARPLPMEAQASSVADPPAVAHSVGEAIGTDEASDAGRVATGGNPWSLAATRAGCSGYVAVVPGGLASVLAQTHRVRHGDNPATIHASIRPSTRPG